MKIFGGRGSRRIRGASKPGKAQRAKKPRSVAKKVLITFLVLILTMATAAGVWLALNVQPPSTNKPHTNNSVIDDPENGDLPAIDLNMGDRIDDFFTFVVCATDIDETRTDNIMVVAFDTKKHTVNVMNIPRDTMSNISRTGANRKINAAYGTSKGIEQTKKQIKQVMGFTPDKFIVVNFQGIAEIVDAIGGVEYEIPFPMMYSDPHQKLKINFPVAGMRKLNGEEVVDFLRWRKNSKGYTHYVPKEYENGDETRIVKQQEFLKHLAKEMLTLKNAINAKKIANAVFGNVKTDITAGEMLWLSGQAFQVDSSQINMFTLPGYAASSTAGNNNELSFYFINGRAALKLINANFNPYDKKITKLDLVSGPTKGTGSSKVDEDEEERPSTKPSRPDEETPSRPPSGDSDGQGNSGDSGDSGGNSGGTGNSGGGDSGGSGNSGGSGGDSGGSGNSGGSGGDSGGSAPNPTPTPPPTDPEA